MRTGTKAFLLTLVLAVGLFTAACPSRTSINDIEANPSKYFGKDVAVAGRVTNSFGIALIGGIYKLDDGTGSIWVVTNRSVPSKGAQVGVKGQVQDGVNYSGKNYGLGLIEEERRSR
jgi:hypothetical protein